MPEGPRTGEPGLRKDAMNLSAPLYALYSRRLRKQVASGPLPRHVGLIMDGNRRWARRMGLANPSLGHQYGADHIEEVLSWCEPLAIRHVTVFVCSTENLTGRSSAEVAFLMHVMEKLAAEHAARPSPRWRLHIAGSSTSCPAPLPARSRKPRRRPATAAPAPT